MKTRFASKRSLGRSKPTWGDDIEMYFKEIGCEDLDWTDMAWNRTCGWLLCIYKCTRNSGVYKIPGNP
jgi:hypothetical protein